MTDQQHQKELHELRLRTLKFSLGSLRTHLRFFRFGVGMPYDLEIAMTHLVESLVSVENLVDYYLDVHESDIDPES